MCVDLIFYRKILNRNIIEFGQFAKQPRLKLAWENLLSHMRCGALRRNDYINGDGKNNCEAVGVKTQGAFN